MTEPALLEVAWTDPVTGCRGYLVIDRLVRGVGLQRVIGASGKLASRSHGTITSARIMFMTLRSPWPQACALPCRRFKPSM